MKTNFVALIMTAITVASCSDNDDPKPEIRVHEGSWKLAEIHHFDKTGKDSATTKLDNSTLSISFDKAKNLASFAGKPESVTMTGSYKMDGNYKLTAGQIATDKTVLTVKDSLALVFLKAGNQYEIKNNTVLINAGKKGFMLYNPVK